MGMWKVTTMILVVTRCNVYLDIQTIDSVITLPLALSEDYSNMELFYKKEK